MKPPIPIYLAVEDDLSEWVLRRLLRDRPIQYAIGVVFKRGGFGYLRKQSPSFNRVARECPVLLLTDLDKGACAADLVKDWLSHPKHRDFLLRVAVRELEAWLLASDAALGKFLRTRREWTFQAPECLSDPKAELLKIAMNSSRRDVKEAIARRDKSGKLRQGPAYNSTLAEFVRRDWLPEVAVTKCPSLGRLERALVTLESDWKQRGS